MSRTAPLRQAVQSRIPSGIGISTAVDSVIPLDPGSWIPNPDAGTSAEAFDFTTGPLGP
jgi:hypothetical protein